MNTHPVERRGAVPPFAKDGGQVGEARSPCAFFNLVTDTVCIPP